MKFETLIIRYKNLGYTPQNQPEEIELELLINWIYKTYDILVFIMFHDKHHIKAFNSTLKKVGKEPKMDAFVAHKIWQANGENPNTFYSDIYCKEPFDAKFHTVKDMYKAIRFQFH